MPCGLSSQIKIKLQQNLKYGPVRALLDHPSKFKRYLNSKVGEK